MAVHMQPLHAGVPDATLPAAPAPAAAAIASMVQQFKAPMAGKAGVKGEKGYGEVSHAIAALVEGSKVLGTKVSEASKVSGQYLSCQ